MIDRDKGYDELGEAFVEPSENELRSAVGPNWGELIDQYEAAEERRVFGDYIPNNEGYRSCSCEDYPCCGH